MDLNNEPKIKFLRVVGHGIIKLSINDIIYIETYKDYVKIYGRDFFYRVASPLTSLINRLDSTAIKRVHRSFAININKVNYIERDQIFLENINAVVSIGTTYKRKFLDSLLIVGEKKSKNLALL